MVPAALHLAVAGDARAGRAGQAYGWQNSR